MARIRSIHPGLCSDPEFVGMSDSAQLLYLLLLTDCDDQGIFEWKPTQLKMRLRPASMAPVDPLLEEMVRADKVASYEMGGRKYGVVRNFRKYQRPKKPNAIFVLPPEFRTYVGLSAPGSELVGGEAMPVPQKGELGPQMEDGGCINPPPAGAIFDGGLNAVPDGWQCPDHLAERLVRETGLSRADIDAEAAKFPTHCRANGRRFADIDAGFGEFCVREVEHRAKRKRGGEPGKSGGNRRSGSQTLADAGREVLARIKAQKTGDGAGDSGGWQGSERAGDGEGSGDAWALRVFPQGPSGGLDHGGRLDVLPAPVSILRSGVSVPSVDGRCEPAQAPDASGHRGEGGDTIYPFPRPVVDGV